VILSIRDIQQSKNSIFRKLIVGKFNLREIDYRENRIFGKLIIREIDYSGNKLFGKWIIREIEFIREIEVREIKIWEI